MGCESCTTGSCPSGDKDGLPPGMLEKYKLNTDRSDGFLVWIEIVKDNGGVQIGSGCREILGKIRSMDAGRSRIWGVVFGHSELKPLYSEIFSLGVETLYEVHDRRLSDFHPEAYADCIARIAIRTEPAVILMGATARGKELAPRVAAKLQTGLTADCTDLSLEDRTLLMTRPAFGGNLLATIRCSAFPQMATVRPGAFPLPEPIPDARGTVIYWQNTCTVLKEILSSESVSGPVDDISKARVIISLGAGVSRSSIPLAEAVAARLGASVACSRKLVEKGWVAPSHQVGQTGRTVSPDIYLAFGISGALQHVAGMSSSKKILAINKDPDAPIHRVADEVIVGDADSVLAELLRILG